ncbi:hypothetical protein E4T42_09312 [Aureobasidium subglaciale]|nr:hypothetical protein E4T38_09791 [Aureobasidium subglaciale]KAI5213377.1 hypothetical protein E4T40_09777 [Aureobasidium subglaciale]KAI5228324.1 hypothetical protein E4T41_03813 [Aureobasidium subglaciale]KAI5236963.1 hypothetical protein E4T42_09312 [Aureobasidium subglaciale]KAI5252972.1 hypothetical protein E4T46_09768 [Aureobasidium subglaciale]
MRYSALIAGLATLVIANPTPQDFDFPEDVDTAPAISVPIGSGTQIIPLDITAAVKEVVADVLTDPSSDIPAEAPNSISKRSPKRARALQARGTCNAQPLGSGPAVYPDTADAFVNSYALAEVAESASTPYGYYEAFDNLQGSVSAAGYRGYKTYTSYDVNKAAADCKAIKGCKAFNIFFERDPSIDPCATNKDPPSTNVIKASFWSVPICAKDATNTGQYREKFHVVIAGSNGYNLVDCAGDVDGWTKETYDGCTINADPTLCTYGGRPDSYISNSRIDGDFIPEACQAACDAKTKSNPLEPCNFVTSWAYLLDGQYKYQVCAFYQRYWDVSYCDNRGQVTSSGKVASIGPSYSYTKKSDNGVSHCPLKPNY